MQAMHSTTAHHCNSLGYSSISAPSLRPCKPARACLALQASKQQQQQEQQQPAPVSNFRDLMQQYRGIAPAAPTTQKKLAPGRPSSSGSSNTKGAPRLKPTQQTSARASKKRATAAVGGGTGSAAVSAKGRAGGVGSPAAAERTGSKAPKSRTADSSSSNSSSSSSRRSEKSSSADSASSSSSAESSKPKSSQPSVIPSAWLMPSNGKGFGSPPAAAAGAPTRSPGGQKIIRVFRFGVEAAAVSKAVEANGWQGRVVLVESIKAADLILAAKCSSGGKHRNLAQGEKAAANAKIPFVVVGRKLSVDNFRQALVPHVEPNSKEAAALAAAAAEAAAKAAANKAAADAFFRSAGGWGKPPR